MHLTSSTGSLAQLDDMPGDRQKQLHKFPPRPLENGKSWPSLVASAWAHFVLFASPQHVFAEREVLVTFCLERSKRKEVLFLAIFQI